MGPTAGGTLAAGIGISASTGATADTTGMICVTSTVCGIIGPIIGGSSNVGYAAQTGKVTSGDVSWSVGGIGSLTVGWGGIAEFSIGGDASIGASGGPSLGAFLGGGLKICRQATTNKCLQIE